MNNGSIRFRLRGKLRSFVLLTCVATALFLIYKALIDDVVFTPGYQASGGNTEPRSRSRGRGTFPDVNDLMPMTQPREHLERMRQQEAQMLRNVQKIIHHRIKETSNRTKNASSGARAASSPSLWDGIGDGDQASPPAPAHVLQRRLVHLDLKGAPPTLDYIGRLFPLLSQLGATGVLIEYEDTFPYSGMLEDVRAHNSYSASDVAQIQRLAAASGLQVIPLVQAFGHLEFVLKREAFRGLREVPAFPQAVCPSNNRTLAVIFEMIDQVMALHRGVSHLHVGCDEVYNIGECPACQGRLERMGWSTEGLFLAHAEAVARHVKTRHRAQPILWDDMFRGIPAQQVRDSGIGRLADLLVWKYGGAVDLTAATWRKYAENFAGVWIASAFKGATGPATVATPVAARLENHVGWMRVVEEFSPLVAFRGIMLTGWQRFDHFAVLCELLPAGIPSMAVNLHYLRHLRYDHEAQLQVQTLLGCSRPIGLELNATEPENRCGFPGARLYELSLRYVTLTHYLDEQFFDSNYIKGWVSDYNVRMRFSSPPLLEQAMTRYGDAVRNVSLFQVAAREALAEVYDRYTVAEWLEINTRPLLKRLDECMAAIKGLLIPNTWPRRPLGVSLPEPRIKRAEAKKRFQHALEP